VTFSRPASLTPTAKSGLSLRQAALTAGFAYLLNPVSYAQFALYPKLVIHGNPAQTAQNVIGHPGLLAATILCYLICFAGDTVIAWALYHLLAPVNRALSLLACVFQLVYTAVAFSALLNLVTVYDFVSTPNQLKTQLTAWTPQQFAAQIEVAFHAFQAGWSFSLSFFGIHLILIGYMIFRSRYIPRILGALLVINGLGWVIDSVFGYIYPNIHIPYLTITFFGEIIFMLWLLIMGWRIKEPATLAGEVIG